jgi:hypothetical protein
MNNLRSFFHLAPGRRSSTYQHVSIHVNWDNLSLVAYSFTLYPTPTVSWGNETVRFCSTGLTVASKVKPGATETHLDRFIQLRPRGQAQE